MNIQFVCKKFYDLSLDELYEAMALRQDVFVVEQDCPYLDADGKDQPAWHLLGFNDQKQIIAYVRILEKGISYENYPSIGRVVTAQNTRGTGAGRLLMLEAIKCTNQLFPGEIVKISAQVYIKGFYESLGFETIGEEYLEDNIPHIAMVRKSG